MPRNQKDMEPLNKLLASLAFNPDPFKSPDPHDWATFLEAEKAAAHQRLASSKREETNAKARDRNRREQEQEELLEARRVEEQRLMAQRSASYGQLASSAPRMTGIEAWLPDPGSGQQAARQQALGEALRTYQEAQTQRAEQTAGRVTRSGLEAVSGLLRSFYAPDRTASVGFDAVDGFEGTLRQPAETPKAKAERELKEAKAAMEALQAKIKGMEGVKKEPEAKEELDLTPTRVIEV